MRQLNRLQDGALLMWVGLIGTAMLFLVGCVGVETTFDADEQMDMEMDEGVEGEMSHGGGERVPNEGAAIRITAPADGATFQAGEQVIVEVEVENFVLGEDGNHWHVYVDDVSWGMVVGGNTDQPLTGLEPGAHEVSAYLSIGTHEEMMDGDSVTIVVEE